MPSWELFGQQDGAYQREVMGGDGTVRVACEAATGFGWERWLGAKGAFVGMKGFGASAKASDLYKHFGITAEAIAEQARQLSR
jgi:transketolase